MATGGAILRGGSVVPGGTPNAYPGGARGAPAPQGQMMGPWGGGPSPVAREADPGAGYAYSYGNFLPRPMDQFTSGAFGPFNPILPIPIDQPEDTGRAAPRRQQYQVGWNLPVGTPGTEGLKLADFSTLRTLADLYSIARACIQLRKVEIRGLDWDIVPTDEASKTMRGSPSLTKDFGKRAAEAKKFFNHPDPNYFSWGAWIDAFLEEVFVFDALSLYLAPKRGKGLGKGLLGSDLDSLWLLNGATIRPLLDLHGGRPRPPAPAYQQYEYGVPRTDLTQVISGRDIEDAGLTGKEVASLRGDQLMYLPMVQRTWTQYGFPPIERALIPIMTGLQKQGYALDFFKEGSIPGLFVSPGDPNMTPNQVRELQDALNTIAGDVAWKHKIIVLPPGSKTEPQRPTALADQFDEIVMSWVCMAFDVIPMELGISPKVSTTQSPGAANQMAKASQDIHQRKATKPTLHFIAGIMDYILQVVADQDDMHFQFEGLEEDQDEQAQTETLVAQIGAGLRSIDEARAELSLQPWNLPETSDPGWASATGFAPLGQVDPSGRPLAGVQQPTGPPAAPGQPPGQPPAAGQPPAGQQQPQQGAKQPPQQPAKQPQQGGTPGHQQAQAATTEAKKPPAKQAMAELEALARHLKKGRRISTWEPVHISAAALAGISEDLAKGLSVDQAVDVAATTIWKRFDPGELRDPHGRWTHGGGTEDTSAEARAEHIAATAAGGNGSPTGFAATQEAFTSLDMLPLSDAQFEERERKVEAALRDAHARGLATSQTHTVDGHDAYTPERAKIHKEIIQGFMEKMRQQGVKHDGKAIIAGGLPGAGKTSSLKRLPGENMNDYAAIAPDDFKEELARRGLVPGVPGLTPMERSPLVSDEAHHLAQLAYDRASKQKMNLVWDTTMLPQDRMKQRVDDLHAKGYKARAVYVDVPLETSVDRATARYRRGVEKYRSGKGGLGGRYVPPSDIRSIWGTPDPDLSVNEQYFNENRDMFDSWDKYDNSTDGPPVLTGSSSQVVPVS